MLLDDSRNLAIFFPAETVRFFLRNELYSKKQTSPFSLPPMNPPPPIPPMILSLLGAGASLVSGLLTTAFFGVSVSVKQNQDNKTQRTKTPQHLENMTKMESLLDIFMCVLLMTSYSSSKY